MKAITLAIILTCFSPSFSKPKFKKIDKYVPLYLRVRNLANDADDEVSLALRKELLGYGFQIVNYETSRKLSKQYSEDVMFYAKSNMKQGVIPDKAQIDRIYRSGTPSQSLTIIYKNSDDKSGTYLNCDSIGFSIMKMPFQVEKSPIQKIMFHVKEITTNNPDSIAQFLISKL